MAGKALTKALSADNKALITELLVQFKRIEKQIQELIQNYAQMQSVPGVGKILFLAKTNEFKTIKTPRKFACYSGIAPFENSSGTSLFERSHVSLCADKSLKNSYIWEQ